MIALIWLINELIGIYIWIIVAQIVLSWLIAFNVINTQNRFVYLIGDFLHRATTPVLKPIRRVMPNLGNIDLSPMILILGLIFLRQLLIFDIVPALR